MASEPVARWIVWHPRLIRAFSSEDADNAWAMARMAQLKSPGELRAAGWVCSPVTAEADNGQ